LPAVVLLSFLLAACSQDAALPVKGDSPSPEAVADKIRPALDPLMRLAQAPPQDNGNFTYVDPDVCNSIRAEIRKAKSDYSDSENGKAALDRIASELENFIKRMRDEDRWGAVLCAIDVHEELKPGMHLMRLLRKRAAFHAMRPHVVVKGFFDDNDHNELYVFLQVTLKKGYQPWPARLVDDVQSAGESGGEEEPDAEASAPAASGRPLERDETHMVQVRVNEEFYGLRLVEVVGNRRGVVLEYLADPGHLFRVMMPARKSRRPRQEVVGKN